MSSKKFSVADYVIFSVMLVVSGVIGLFFAWRHRRLTSSAEYLLASHTMSWFPVFVSLVATFFSAIGVMGIPAQVYMTGITYAFQMFCYMPTIVFSAEVLVPMYRQLNITSINQYLEMRYSLGIRYLGCFFFHLQYLMYLSIALYAPSLALQSVAGVPIAFTVLATGAVCTLYTSLGGMRAVIWTDVFQSVVMLFGLSFTAILGINEVGGLTTVFNIASKFERTQIDVNPDPRALHSIWGVVIGAGITFAPVWTIAQPTVQRINSARSNNHARAAMYSSLVGLAVLFAILSIVALVVFAVYADCDLVLSKKITSNDQIVPYFVVDKLSRMPGVPGLFTACLFSFALSTLSSGVNGISALFLEDVVRTKWPNISDKQATKIGKWCACLCGVFIVGFAFVVPLLGNFVMRLTTSLWGIVGCPYMALFLLGMFTSCVNSKGVATGAITGLCLTLWISVGQQLYPPDKNLPPISVSKCDFYNTSISNSSAIIFPKAPQYDAPITVLYSISYTWFGLISLLTAVVVSIPASILFDRCSGTSRKRIDPRLQYDWQQNTLLRMIRGRKQRTADTELDTILHEKKNEF